MAEYIEYKRNVRKVVSGDTLASISEQIIRMENSLKSDQDALAAFQKTNNLAVLQEEGTIAGGYLARLKTQVSDLELEARMLEATALEQSLNAGTNANAGVYPTDPLQAGGSTASPAVTERHTAFKQLELLKFEREQLSKDLKPKTPQDPQVR